MTPLDLRPFPCLFNDEPFSAAGDPRGGFVDDAVVIALLAGPVGPRVAAHPEDLALAADDLDFAGWCLAREPFSGMAAEAVAMIPESDRRATRSAIEEPGLGVPHRGEHRWWLAGLAGAMSTLLFSLLLLTLASRESVTATDGVFSKVPAGISGTASDPVTMKIAIGSRTVDPQLTAVEPWEVGSRKSGDVGQ